MSEESSWIEVELYYLAEHQWKDAPDHRGYLRPKHQHIFKVTVRLSVSHGEREVEFHDLRSETWAYMQDPIWNNSCENIAKTLFNLLKESYPGNRLYVVVAEEGGLKGKYGHAVI